MNEEKIAQHEAAHGIVWYLFRTHWIVNQLTIERVNLPDKEMKGALQITPNFNTKEDANIERANELFAISLAGLIGQNIRIILERPNLVLEILQNGDFNVFLKTSGCGGDFEIAKRFLPHLGREFRSEEGAYTMYKVLDLIGLFQDHEIVQYLHDQLSRMLLEKRTLLKEELICFFDKYNFSEYVEDENLDINFFHMR